VQVINPITGLLNNGQPKAAFRKFCEVGLHRFRWRGKFITKMYQFNHKFVWSPTSQNFLKAALG